MFQFRLPDIGEGLSEGELLEWHVAPGDTVKEGDDIASISTDKVSVVLPSPRSGLITARYGKPGDIIPVGSVLIEFGDKIAEPARQSPAPQATARTTVETTQSATVPANPTPRAASVKAGPAIRAYAKARGVELSKVPPSSPDGAILRKDIDLYLAASDPKGSPPPQVKTERLKGAALKAATHLADAARTLAPTTLMFDVVATGIVQARARLHQEVERHGIKLSPLPIIAKCVACALRRHSRFNATLGSDEHEYVLNDDVHLGIAVDTAAGLLVPVIRHAAGKTIVELAIEIAAVSQRARAGRLGVDELRGSTFTLSSTGGMETTRLIGTTPIVNVPNVATLWTSRITERPWVLEGTLRIAPVMSCSLTFDHRFLHGAQGIAFANDLDTTFQNPQAPQTGPAVEGGATADHLPI